MTRLALSDHLAAAMLSAWAGAVGVYVSLVACGVGSAVGGGQPVVAALGSGILYGTLALAVAVIPFGIGSAILGPIAYLVLLRFKRTGPVAASIAGAALSGCVATPLFMSLDNLFGPLIVVISIGGAAAAWTYRRALMAMAALPPDPSSNAV